MKVILITGVSSGFGREMALTLSSQGHKVYGVSRRIPEADVLSALTGHIQADLCKPEASDIIVSHVLAQQDRIDVLINNAGSGIGGALEETADEALENLFRINFFAMTRLCRAVLPSMRARHAGLILNFSSLGGLAGLPYQGAYSATKFAVEGYSEALHSEVKSFGIHVSLMEPGDFSTGFTGNRVMATAPDSPYRADHQAALKRIEADEQGGTHPRVLARKVAKIIARRRPRLRYTAGNPAECLLVKARHLFGDRLFLFLLRKYYGLR
ncbi:MAG: SDR family oxidoreductase [Oscillospiraceae bacterium]|nr:SDR family oxidoreductase [Oscillospiraceae bacterium]